jgi:hypothetical protein
VSELQGERVNIWGVGWWEGAAGGRVNIWAEFVFERQRNDEMLIRDGGHNVTGGFRRGGLGHCDVVP